jgi:hypothetical protein
MIEAFIKWVEANKHKLAERGIAVSTHRDKKLPNLDFYTAAVAEFESKKLGGSIIYYHTGEYDINVFKNNNGNNLEEVFLEVHEPKNEFELLALLEKTFERIYSYQP